ncbi:MAG: peptide chain release factor 1 [bacterium]|nr:peptide chain release factor 1 [bacterium]
MKREHDSAVAGRLEALGRRLAEVEAEMSDPAVISRQDRYRLLAREHAAIREVLSLEERRLKARREIEESERLLEEAAEDGDFRALVEGELRALREREAALDEELTLALLPRGRDDDRGTIVEIRAGTGGGEAALFVADLFRMYARYAERMGWAVETMDSHPTGIGGFKEIVFSLAGREVFRRMKYESGVHRVQRVPATEASGRIHTSAATVAVLPEAEEVEVELAPGDIRVDVYRSSGPGGQSVNTTDSAVRITHLPTGLVVTCQDEKSQHKNKTKAMRILRARLREAMEEARDERLSTLRRAQVSTGDRSAKIRTYNFPQNRVTDHRVGLTLHDLQGVMNGALEKLTAALIERDREERLRAAREDAEG